MRPIPATQSSHSLIAGLILALCVIPDAYSDNSRQHSSRTRSGDTVASGFRATDPGVRGGDPGAGDPLPGLSPGELVFFDAGRADFVETEGVGDGLGPRFNLDNCVGCHSQPAIGGSSPAVNPQVAAAGCRCCSQNGARPGSMLSSNGGCARPNPVCAECSGPTATVIR